jgi:hypothetical protein
MERKNEPTLYLILRRDLQDMNPGKAVAQGSHATDDFNAWKNKIIRYDYQYSSKLISEFLRWQEDRNFGRCIVLQGTLEEMANIVQCNDFADLTTDPSYPWENWYGDVFLTEEVTAAWCFICDETTACETLRGLSLHR